jgi:hypothetical protein
MFVILAALSISTPAFTQGEAKVDGSPYHRTFADALAALDAGDNEAAAQWFARAGESAPDAPVWRVHAAVAHVRAGRADQARTLARAALERGYDVSDLAAIEPALVPPDEELARVVERTASAETKQRLALVTLPERPPRPTGDSSKTTHAARTSTRPLALCPSVAPGPFIKEVHVRDADDALFACIDGGWRRLDLERLQLVPPDGDAALVGADPWARPRLQPPDTVVRDRIFALVGQRGGEEVVPITLSPKGDSWLYFQTAGPFDSGEECDLLNVVDRDVTRVVATLGRTTDVIGPISLWPPYFSPSGDILAVSGLWGASLHVFDTRDWSRRFDVAPRVDKGTSGGCDLSLPNERRLYAVDHCGINTHLCEVYDLATGVLLFRGEEHGYMTIDGTSDDRIVLASSVERPSAIVVLDGRDFSPVLDVWVTTGAEGQLVTATHAVDGTFDSIPPFARDLVLVGDASLGASQAALAPWLLDPLHVRSMARDTDRAPRPVPLALLSPFQR